MLHTVTRSAKSMLIPTTASSGPQSPDSLQLLLLLYSTSMTKLAANARLTEHHCIHRATAG